MVLRASTVFPLSQIKVGSFCFIAPVGRTGCGGLLVSTDCVRRRWQWSVLLCTTAAFTSTFSRHTLKTLDEFPENSFFLPFFFVGTWKGWERSGEKA